MNNERLKEYYQWWNSCPLWQQLWEDCKTIPPYKPENDPTSPKWHGNKTTRARNEYERTVPGTHMSAERLLHIEQEFACYPESGPVAELIAEVRRKDTK